MGEMDEARKYGLEKGEFWAVSNPYKKVRKCLEERLERIDKEIYLEATKLYWGIFNG